MTKFNEYKIDLPLIDDSCKNGNCGHEHMKIVSNEPAKPEIQAYIPPAAATTPPATTPPVEPGHEGHNHTPKQDFTHGQIAGSMPSSINFGKCTGDNCGDKIKNKNLNKDFKSCPGCGDNSNPSKAKFCKTCGKDEPKDDDEKADYWEDSEIDTDAIKEDE